MAKDAYYFSHDYNARRDPKIIEMIFDYKAVGYGLFWATIEMLAEQDGYKLKKDTRTCKAIAMEMQCERIAVEKWIDDCIAIYELFLSDGVYFWSNSLLTRMKIKEEKSEKARKSAQARWKKPIKEENESEVDAFALETHSDCNADVSEGNANKGNEMKEIKEKEIDTDKTPSKKHYADNVKMTEEEYLKLIAEYGEPIIKDKIIDLDLWKGSKGKKTKSDYLTIKSWIRKDQKQVKPQTKPNGIKEIPKNPKRRDDF